MNFIFQIIIAIAMAFAAAFLTPRQKQPKPEVEELDSPTADAGKEIPWIFGTLWVESGNVIFSAEKSSDTDEIDA